MIGLEVNPKLANKKNKRARASIYDKSEDDSSCKEPNKRPKLTNEQEVVQKICLFDSFSHRKYYSFVMNEAQLNAEQRSRLWHWRLGHPSHSSHYYMNKRGNIKDHVNVLMRIVLSAIKVNLNLLVSKQIKKIYLGSKQHHQCSVFTLMVLVDKIHLDVHHTMEQLVVSCLLIHVQVIWISNCINRKRNFPDY